MTNIDWSGVRDRVAALSTTPDAKVFGANGHGWLLDPPLRPAELAELEEQLGVRLPEDYRGFLLEVGRGGAGPFYGLFPLRRVDGRWRWEGDGADLTEIRTLAEPFPHTGPFNPAAELPEPPDEEDFGTVEEFNAAEDAYWELHDRVAYDPLHTVGAVYLCHLGCAYRHLLVVSGPERGAMWADDTADDGGFTPLAGPHGERIGFARWYLDWLDEATAKAREPLHG
ncbi:SMI1/KNR4 family protein [Plantactinospora sp. CA-294935]|uniref:SMI1/KNR4 family protein n=1 Tax=Plantactinospora sp. CA-294935 TaxID=3240012 RepID=UPI003D90CFCB